jgi:hypothetical protein
MLYFPPFGAAGMSAPTIGRGRDPPWLARRCFAFNRFGTMKGK